MILLEPVIWPITCKSCCKEEFKVDKLRKNTFAKSLPEDSKNVYHGRNNGLQRKKSDASHHHINIECEKIKGDSKW